MNPFADIPSELIKDVYEKPGQRITILIPKLVSHGYRTPVGGTPDEPLIWAVGEGHNWDVIEEIQMEFRGSTLRSNVFVTLRFDQNTEGEVTLDVCHLA